MRWEPVAFHTMGLASLDSVVHRLQIFGGKKFQKVPKGKTWAFHALATTYIAYTLCSATYLHSIYVTNGEGNGTPLQYFCLENPMDGGAW